MEILNAPGTNMSSIDKVKAVPYASAVGSLQHAQVCTRPDLAFVIGFYLQIPEQFWNRTLKLVKKVLRYLQGTKSLMMTYRRSDSLHIVRYSDSDYAGDNRKIHVRICIHSRRGSYFMKKLKANCHYIVHNV